MNLGLPISSSDLFWYSGLGFTVGHFAKIGALEKYGGYGIFAATILKLIEDYL